MRPQPVTLAELREAMGFRGEAPPPPPPPHPPPRPPPPPAPAPPPVMSSAISVDAKADLTSLLNEWEESQRGTTETLVSILTRISELIEGETAEYHKADPDPFDDRHPGRADPECMLGQLLKMLFNNDDFTNALLDNYIMTSRELDLNTASCRLLQNIMPGLETAAVFQEKEGLVEKLFSWSREAERPLNVFSTGLLARAMSNQEVAASYRDENALLVPIMIQRLHELQKYRLSPLSAATEQRLILQYLTPLGDYQELLAVFMQLDTRSLLMNYIDLKKNRNVQLIFDALLYLASLLLHKKFAAEFITHGGVQRLLEIPRPSMAATGVSLCLYYLAYNQDAMERVCTLPDGVLSDTVSYALWLLESSHASGVCHATMFFSISFSCRAVLTLFDRHDGLRRLVNLVSTLQILNTESEVSLMSDDQVFSNRQTAKHTCMALRRYFEAHLAVKAEQVKQSLHNSDGGSTVPQQPFYKAYTYTREQVIEMMEYLIESAPPQLHWEPVELFYKMSCVPLMLQLISTACDWRTYYGRSDTVRYALDILALLVVVPKVQLVLAETVEVLDETRSPVSTVGMSIILGVAEGEVFVHDAEIQKSALQVIINCVCAPDQSLSPGGGFPPAPPYVLHLMWQLVQNNNGIKVLLSVLSVKMPITDADLIRALACKALVGLSRSAAIRQIISKLPLFTSSHIQQVNNNNNNNTPSGTGLHT
ncbi:hypothetical protein JOQ06_014911 [Pogonophryne albipinna]|uniref:VPRBP n=1 Tax=Pogonophryne albipinna TaxID=1090488 RepID=A0AAD6AMV9_9TELE|nr:hypothetical protein JOQ06_014911 [Pogonophryne albipinna]